MTTNKLTDGQCGICSNCVPQINGGSGFTNCAEAHAAEIAGDNMKSNKLTEEQLTELLAMARKANTGCTVFEMDDFQTAMTLAGLMVLEELQERRQAAVLTDKDALREKFEAWAEEACALPWGTLKKHRNQDGTYTGVDYTSMWHAVSACHEPLLDELAAKEAELQEYRKKELLQAIDFVGGQKNGIGKMIERAGGTITHDERFKWHVEGE